MEVDPAFGTEDEFRRLCATAAEYDGTVIDDIVPGHTGKGADFRLAEMGYGDYPGIYHMVSIRPDDWHLLPDVPDGRDSVNLDGETEAALERAGYIIGQLQRVIFYEPGVKETNWSVTRAGAWASTASSGAGSTCTTSRRASRRSTGSTRPSPGCGS